MRKTRDFRDWVKSPRLVARTLNLGIFHFLLSSRVKTKGRRMLGMAVSTLFLQDLSALGVKASVT